jgi:hypothetical protein
MDYCSTVFLMLKYLVLLPRYCQTLCCLPAVDRCFCVLANGQPALLSNAPPLERSVLTYAPLPTIAAGFDTQRFSSKPTAAQERLYSTDQSCFARLRF